VVTAQTRPQEVVYNPGEDVADQFGEFAAATDDTGAESEVLEAAGLLFGMPPTTPPLSGVDRSDLSDSEYSDGSQIDDFALTDSPPG